MAHLHRNGSFAAQGDDGRHYLVVNWSEFVDSNDDGPGLPRLAPSGFECLRLDDGRPVSTLDGARYEIIDSGVLLEPIRAVAPRTAAPSPPARAAARVVAASAAGTTAGANDMAHFGVRRVGRFYVWRGHHFASLEEAIAGAGLAGGAPERAAAHAMPMRSPGQG